MPSIIHPFLLFMLLLFTTFITYWKHLFSTHCFPFSSTEYIFPKFFLVQMVSVLYSLAEDPYIPDLYSLCDFFHSSLLFLL